MPPKDAEDVDTAKKRRSAGKARFTRMYNTLLKLLAEPQPPSEVDLMSDLQDLTNHFNDLEQYHENVCSHYDNEAEIEADKYMDDSLEKFHDVRRKVNALILRTRTKPAPKPKFDHVKLDRLPIPSFSGKIREYPVFKFDFQNHVQTRVEETDSLRYLKGSVPDKFKPMISGCTDLATAWTRLEARFGNRREIAAAVMTEIREVSPIRENEHSKFVGFVELLETASIDLKRINMEDEIAHSSTITLIENKLPMEILKQWRLDILHKHSALNGKELYKAFIDYLSEWAQVLRGLPNFDSDSSQSCSTSVAVEQVPVVNMPTNALHQPAVRAAAATTPGDDFDRTMRCPVHKSNTHPLANCFFFKKQTGEEKKMIITKCRLCKRCLANDHFEKDCTSEPKCNQAGCTGKHLSVLHAVFAIQFSFATELENTHTIRPVVEGYISCGEMAFNPLTILMDGGSTISLITQDCVDQNHLKKVSSFKYHVNLEVVGGDIDSYDSYQYYVPLCNITGQEVATVTAYSVPKLSSKLAQISTDSIEKLFDAPSGSILRPTGSIHLLIGCDNSHAHPTSDKMVDGLRLDNSVFGPVPWGKHQSIIGEDKIGCSAVVTSHKSPSVDVSDFYATESLGVECNPRCGGCRCGKCAPGSSGMSIKEEFEYRMIEELVILYPELQRIIAGYPWIRDPNLLPNNFFAVLQSLFSLENKLLKDPVKAEMYNDQVVDSEEKGITRILTSGEKESWTGPVHYLAHDCIFKRTSKSTPLRLYYDPSRNYMGHILNQYWAKGPNVVGNLLAILLRFCEEFVPICGDIRKYYNTIWTRELEHHCHRFLWRNLETNRPPDTYVVQRNSFGDGPAGVIAAVGLRKCADYHRHEYPDACKTIEDQTYVDDILDSLPTIEDAQQRILEVEKILAIGGFELKPWIIGGTDEVINEAIRICPDITDKERVLGVDWNPKSDKFTFSVCLNFSPRRKAKFSSTNYNDERTNINLENFDELYPASVSRRTITSCLNGFRDPFGFTQPVIVKSKISLGRLWKREDGSTITDWDAPIPEKENSVWKELFREMLHLEKIVFGRCLRPNDSVGNPWLIVFSDSSIKAYGACVYIRWKCRDGSYWCRLIISKTKPWPIDPGDSITLVRGEMCGAVMGKRLAKFIKTESRYEIEKEVYIVDSEIVRAMIMKNSHNFHTFIANRVGEIRSATEPDWWWWIPGAMNIADYLTRGKKPEDLAEGSIWQIGLPFMYTEFESWPISQNVSKSQDTAMLPETRIKHVSAHTYSLHEKPEDELTIAYFMSEVSYPCFNTSEVRVLVTDIVDIESWSNYRKLINVTARFIIWKDKIVEKRTSKNTNYSSLGSFYKTHITSVESYRLAEQYWIKRAQSSLSEAIRKGQFKSLHPELDECGIWRVSGRLNKKSNYLPILLPHTHPFSRLVMLATHLRGHNGIDTTVAKSRRKYWITQATTLAKAIRRDCVTCRFLNATRVQVRMAPLPDTRNTPAKPFENIALDLFGPIRIKPPGRATRARVNDCGKVWVILLNCLYSRAIHCEVMEAYDTAQFLVAFRAFQHIRGKPKTCYADNGSQIVAADGALKALGDVIDKQQVCEFGARQDTEFIFNKPGSPWQNGCSEALIKSTKRCLRYLTGSEAPRLTVMQLQRVLTGIANLLNDRPIGRHPKDPEQGHYLCPNDLLLGRASTAIDQGPWPDMPGKAGKFTNQLVLVERIIDEFHKQFVKLCFHALVVEKKWHVDVREVKVGDLVLIRDLNLIRGQWKRGQIIEVYKSNVDDKIRSCKLRTKLTNHDNLMFCKFKDSTEIRDVKNLVMLLPVEEHMDITPKNNSN